MEYPFIIGTAGHIDHGKTQLVKSLTGVDCDSLSEEKKRGITIELGFAPLLLPSGRTVSIVDVPGHERFIRQMVAGATGIDFVMLVVAADEGVMPQTREHLDILNLLGIGHGLVVLTKVDLVDAEMLELAREDVTSLVAGTFLEGAPVVPVSSVSGLGLDVLAAIIDERVTSVPTKEKIGAFFMPIDRAFSIRGFGSVATGTVHRGHLREGDEVDVMPSALRTKVRSVQVHGEPAEIAVAGQRTALNLASVSLERLKRGDVVCAPGRFSPTDCFDAEVLLLPSVGEPLAHWQRVRLHVGTSDVVARIAFVSSKNEGPEGEPVIRPGQSGIVQILPEAPLVVTAGQRFVMRFYSPLVTIGGGRVLLPHAERPKNQEDRSRKEELLSALIRDYTSATLLEATVKEKGLLSESALFDISQMEEEDFAGNISKLLDETQRSGIRNFGVNPRFFIAEWALSNISNCLISSLESFHADHPELAGLDAEELHSALPAAQWLPLLQLREFKDLLKLLVSMGRLLANTVGKDLKYAVYGFKAQGDEKLLALAGRLLEAAEGAGFEMLEISALHSLLKATPGEVAKAIGYLRESDGLRIIGDGLVLTRGIADKICALVGSLDGDITIATVRDAMGTSRKYALAALEFLDGTGLTRRVGDKRVLLKR